MQPLVWQSFLGLKHSESPPCATICLAISLTDLGKYQEAIASLDKALEINPDLDLAWNNHGAALFSLGKHQEAIADYDKAIEINPDYHEAWYNKAASYAQQNDLDSALKNLEHAFSLNAELRESAKTDSNFDAIRGDQRFKDLIENSPLKN